MEHLTRIRITKQRNYDPGDEEILAAVRAEDTARIAYEAEIERLRRGVNENLA